MPYFEAKGYVEDLPWWLTLKQKYQKQLFRRERKKVHVKKQPNLNLLAPKYKIISEVVELKCCNLRFKFQITV